MSRQITNLGIGCFLKIDPSIAPLICNLFVYAATNVRLALKIVFMFSVIGVKAQFSKLAFVENKGQWNEKVQFRAKIPDGQLYMEKDRLTYVFHSANDMARMHYLRHHTTADSDIPRDYVMDMHAFQVHFVDSKLEQIASFSPTSDYENYYLGNDPKKWASDVRKYGELVYQDLYAGIDLHFYHHQGHMKYDFKVQPGEDPSRILLQYDAVDDLFINKGVLNIHTSVNEILEQQPYAYQVIKGKERPVKCRFHVEGNTVSFAFPRGYNKKYELIIDPILVFSSYSGSTADNWGYTATYDDDGNLYAGGIAFGTGYPTSLGAYQIIYGGGNVNQVGTADISISKFSSDGTALIYSTYLGGGSNESPHSLIVNHNNELLVLGTTSSIDFPTANAYDNSFNGGTLYSSAVIPDYNDGSDIIVAKFNSSGTSLLGSTFVGGSDNDGLNGDPILKYNYADDYRGEIIVDDNDAVYVASSTFSTDFPTPGGTVQTTNAGGQDGCIFKLSSDLSTLIWGSYIGGSGGDAAYAIQLDEEDNILLTGGTYSFTFPNYQGGVDGFIYKLNNSATSLIAGTCVGTSEYDQSFFIQADTSNNVYVVGQTEGPYPVKPASVYNEPFSGQFLHKFSPDLTDTIFCTTFGRPGGTDQDVTIDISLSAFLVNDCDRIFISGWGGNTNAENNGPPFSTTNDLPITPDAVQNTTDGSDYYLLVLDENAGDMLYATYFGGDASNDHVDGGTSRFDKRGIVYQAVCASCEGVSADFPTTPNAWSSNNGSGNCNLGVFKIDLSLLTAILEIDPSSSFCLGDSVFFENRSNGGETFFWDFGDGSSSTEENPSHVYTAAGTYDVMLVVSDLDACKKDDTTYVEVTIHQPANVSIDPIANICRGDSIMLSADGGVSYSWSPQEHLNNSTISNPTAAVYENTTYSVEITDSLGCLSSLSTDAMVLNLPSVNVGADLALKWGGEGATMDPITDGISYLWEPAAGLSCDTCLNPFVNPEETVTYIFTVQDANGCYNRDTITIFVDGSIYAPSSFSPNGDGFNDIFYAYGRSIAEFELFIFDRWGEVIYYSTDMEEGWDGKRGKKYVKTETYLWLINYKGFLDEQGSISGTVTVLK